MKMDFSALKALKLVRDYTILDYYEDDDDGEIYVIYADRAVNDDGTIDVHVVPFDPVLEVTERDPIDPAREREVIGNLLAQKEALQDEPDEEEQAAAAQELLCELDSEDSSLRFTLTETECKVLRKNLEYASRRQADDPNDDRDAKPL